MECQDQCGISSLLTWGTTNRIQKVRSLWNPPLRVGNSHDESDLRQARYRWRISRARGGMVKRRPLPSLPFTLFNTPRVAERRNHMIPFAKSVSETWRPKIHPTQ